MKPDKAGNVVIAYTSDTVLMLDCDLKTKEEVIEFSRDYTKFHDLGSALVMRTSLTPQVDLFAKSLGNFCIIFGKVLHWKEIQWHINECYRLQMINKAFQTLRKYGYITIRVNAKNDDKPYPTIENLFEHGDKEAIQGFLNHWQMCKELGKSESL